MQDGFVNYSKSNKIIDINKKELKTANPIIRLAVFFVQAATATVGILFSKARILKRAANNSSLTRPSSSARIKANYNYDIVK